MTYRLDELQAPLLLLAAGQDHTPAQLLRPHSGEHEAACADAWMRMLGFIDRYAG